MILYTDGACSPNPGFGGWGAVLISPGHNNARRELSGAHPATTNNRMEMLAAVEGLQALKYPCRVLLHTDSQYLRQGFASGWVEKWVANGWKTSAKTDVLNKDLWLRLLELTEVHEVTWVWVKGHAGIVENDRADALAVAAREQLAAAAR